MSRPSPKILLSTNLGDGSTWDITDTDSYYIITYLGRPCGVRQHVQTMKTQGFRYQKLTYTGLGSVKAQVRRLNHKFNCTDFGYVKVA